MADELPTPHVPVDVSGEIAKAASEFPERISRPSNDDAVDHIAKRESVARRE